MLKVKAEVRASHVHGLGLFAIERIPKGATVWTYDDDVDRIVIDKPTNINFAWEIPSAVESKMWVVPGDDARYINHSITPNLVTDEDGLSPSYAARDIEPGEEITESYSYDIDYVNYSHKLK